MKDFERRIPIYMRFGIALCVLGIALTVYGYRMSDDPRFKIYCCADVKPIEGGMFQVTYEDFYLGEDCWLGPYIRFAHFKVILAAIDGRVVPSAPEVITWHSPKIYLHIGQEEGRMGDARGGVPSLLDEE